MELREVLWRKKDGILEAWLQLVLQTYQPEVARFLREEKDPFANPVGHTLQQGLGGIYDKLLEGGPLRDVQGFLDQITRIRAVQDLSAGQAVSFVLLLKRAIWEELGEDLGGQIDLRDWLVWESKIDELALLSFDLYTACKKQIYDIRLQETRNHIFRLLQKANVRGEDASSL